MDTRETIIMHARNLWAARGYEGTGVQEICQEAGITKPALYHHFGSKAGLLDAVLEGLMEPWCAMVSRDCAWNHDITGNLQNLARDWFALVRTDPAGARLYLVLGTAGRDSESGRAMRPWTDRLESTLRELFRNAAGDHGNMRDREVPYAAAFQGLLDAWTRLHAFQGREIPESLGYPVVHHFMHGIFS